MTCSKKHIRVKTREESLYDKKAFRIDYDKVSHKNIYLKEKKDIAKENISGFFSMKDLGLDLK